VNRRQALSALAVGIVGAGFRPAKGLASNPGRENVDWVAQVLTRMNGIKPGMARVDLLKVFTVEGGLSTGLQRTFVSQQCPYFKVDVTFRAVGRSERDQEGRVTLTEDPRDEIVSMSKPYLAFAIPHLQPTDDGLTKFPARSAGEQLRWHNGRTRRSPSLMRQAVSQD